MVFSGRITLKNKFLSSLTGVEPMITQKYQLDALTTELWRTPGEQGSKLRFLCVTHVLPYLQGSIC